MTEMGNEPLILEVIQRKGKPCFKKKSGIMIGLQTKRPLEYAPTFTILDQDAQYLYSYGVSVERSAHVLYCHLMGTQTHNDLHLFLSFGRYISNQDATAVAKAANVDEETVRSVPEVFSDVPEMFKDVEQCVIRPEHFQDGDTITIYNL